jgi:hypothetical protein
MAQYNFQLRGWPAVLAIAGLAGITGVQMYLRVRPVDDAMRDAVRAELVKDYSGRSSRDLARLVAEARQGAPAESLSLPPLVRRDVAFTSIAARGSAGGAIVVRAEVTVDGGPPPDGRPVRYFWVSRKFAESGWIVMAETDSYRYFMALLPASRNFSIH